MIGLKTVVRGLLGGLVFCLPGGAALGQDDTAAHFDELQSRLFAANYVPVNPALVTPLRAALQADGTFSDIQYATNPLDAYQLHLERVTVLARALAAGRLQGDPAIYLEMVRALDYWLVTDYRDPNWWWTYIGFPGRLIPVTSLTAGKLRDTHPAVYDRLIGYHNRVYNYSQVNPHGYGANLSDMGYRALVGAIMDRNATQVERITANTFHVALNVLGRATTRDGWRPDGTMFGHGPQLHNATYGREMALSATHALALLRGTRWDLGQPMLDLVEDQLLEAVLRMSYGPWFDFNAAGRAVSRPSGQNLGNGYISIVETVLQLAPRHPQRLAMLLDRLRSGPRLHHNVTGTKSFYYSDFITHIRRNYYASVRMISNRTNRNEMLNGEGLKNLFFGDGIQFTLVHGDEYSTMGPLFDYARLPGLTARQVASLQPQASMGQRGTDAFANSVTDGTTGLAAMRLRHMDTVGWKSWFMIEEGIVALGSGIGVTNSNHGEKVITTLNQTRQGGTVHMGRTAEPPISHHLPFAIVDGKYDWVWHRDVGYVLLGDNPPLSIQAATVAADWADVGASSGAVSGDVLTLHLDHGVQPNQGAYSYMVLPAIDAAQTAAYAAEPPVDILRHDAWVHAVRHRHSGSIYAAFLGANTLELGDGRAITASHPLLLMLVPRLGQWVMTVVDARFNLMTASVDLDGFALSGGDLQSVNGVPGRQRVSVQFPQGDAVGSQWQRSFQVPDAPPYRLGDEQSATGGVRDAAGFGVLVESGPETGWVYHLDAGWIYLRADTVTDLHFYNPQRAAWMWSSADLPGVAYRYDAHRWESLADGVEL
jgi:chondroitin AC lyase